jgi:hypothetical protein
MAVPSKQVLVGPAGERREDLVLDVLLGALGHGTDGLEVAADLVVVERLLLHHDRPLPVRDIGHRPLVGDQLHGRAVPLEDPQARDVHHVRVGLDGDLGGPLVDQPVDVGGVRLAVGRHQLVLELGPRQGGKCSNVDGH